MKLHEIVSEAPYYIPGPMTSYGPQMGSITKDQLATNYHQIGRLLRGESVMMSNDDKLVVVITPGEHEQFRPIARAKIKSPDVGSAKLPSYLRGKKVIQIASVSTDASQQSRGIASQLYDCLADVGYVIVSDNVQYQPATHMWKKLARTTTHNVIVIAPSGPISKDGKAINYNGSNIPDDQIWSTDDDISGLDKFFVLLK